jgi:hypothetical protein
MDRKAHWLDRERLTVYPRIFVALWLIIAAGWIFLSKDGVGRNGKPLGWDFIAFWASSYMSLTGHAVDAFNVPMVFAVEKIAVPASKVEFSWYYPPTFDLVILPLALLPYGAAFWTWMVATFSCYVAVFRRVTKSPAALWCLVAFPGVWMNLLPGQNAFLTASLAAGALLCLPKRPILAGVLIGLLAIKPHLALLFPVALIAIEAWSAFMTAGLTAAALTALGTAVLGVDTLKSSLASLHFARLFLQSGVLPWIKMPTVFACLRLLGVPVDAAYVVHGIVALLALAAVWRVWRHCGDWQLRGAALMTGTFLISPYSYDYDLAWLAFPIAWMALIGLRDGWRKWEREAMVFAWLVPFLMAPVAAATHVQLGPFAVAGLLWVIVRMAGAESSFCEQKEAKKLW